jgi:transcriptional regulator with XRE-family HTH domain
MDWNSISNENAVQETGKRLKAHRINKRLTQKQLAEKAGISLFTVAQIEKGKPVSISMLMPVLRILRLLDNMELLIPETQISPVALLKQSNKHLKRVRQKKRM